MLVWTPAALDTVGHATLARTGDTAGAFRHHRITMEAVGIVPVIPACYVQVMPIVTSLNADVSREVDIICFVQSFASALFFSAAEELLFHLN